MRNACDHECLVCLSVYTHLGDCGQPFHDVCRTCAGEGWQVQECSKCEEWVPIQSGFYCEQCKPRKVLAA